MKANFILAILLVAFSININSQTKAKTNSKKTSNKKEVTTNTNKESTVETIEEIQPPSPEERIETVVGEIDQVVVEEKFSSESNKSITPIGNGFSLISQSSNYKSKYGINDKFGKTILPCDFDYITEQGNFITAQIGNFFGVYDINMKQILPFEYSSISILSKTDAIIASGTDYSGKLFDKNGKQIFIENATNISPFYTQNKEIENRYLTVFDAKYRTAIYDLEAKKIIRNYDNCQYQNYSSEAILYTSNTSSPANTRKSQLLDLNFKPKSSLVYDNLLFISPNYFIANLKGKYGVIDDNEKNLIPYEYEGMYYSYTNPITLISKKNGKFGLLTLSAKELIPFQYDSLYFFNNSIICKKNGKYGVLDLFGTSIIKENHDSIITNFYNKFVFIKDEKVICYSNNGEVKNQYLLKNFNIDKNTSTVVVKNDIGKIGVLGSQLDVIIPFEYDDIKLQTLNYSPLYFVSSKTKNGVYKENRFIPLEKNYDRFIPFKNHYLVVKNDKYGLLNGRSFQEILPCEYDIISTNSSDYSSQLNKVIAIKGGESKTIDVR